MDEREARFTRLYETYYRNVFGYVGLRVGPHAAEDVTGEVFTIAWRKIDEIPERALPWLLGVARNLTRQSYGAAGRARGLFEDKGGVPRLRTPGLGEQDRRPCSAWRRFAAAASGASARPVTISTCAP